MPAAADLPNDLEALRTLLVERSAALAASSAKLEAAEALLLFQKLELEKLRFQIACLKRIKYGRSSEALAPHVSTGMAPRDYLDKMLAEPFDSFTFSPAGAAVYQLGPFGSAAKKLKEWKLNP